MYVCICNAITDKEIIEAQKNGHTSIKKISQHLGVGTCCGRCIDTAKQILNENSGVQKYAPPLMMPSPELRFA